MVSQVVSFNPQKGGDDPFDYAQVVTQGSESTFINDDGSRSVSRLDDQGRVVETRTLDAQGREEQVFTFVYDAQGRMTESTTRAADGSLFTSRYGPDGQIAESLEVKPDGTRSSVKRAGDQTVTVVTDSEGRVILDSRELERVPAQP